MDFNNFFSTFYLQSTNNIKLIEKAFRKALILEILESMILIRSIDNLELICLKGTHKGLILRVPSICKVNIKVRGFKHTWSYHKSFK